MWAESIFSFDVFDGFLLKTKLKCDVFDAIAGDWCRLMMKNCCDKKKIAKILVKGCTKYRGVIGEVHLISSSNMLGF